MIELFHIILQAAPSADSLPGWITTGGSVGSIALLSWLLYRAERRLDDSQQRLDACEERYRQMVDKYSERTFDSVQRLGDAVNAVHSATRRRGGE